MAEDTRLGIVRFDEFAAAPAELLAQAAVVGERITASAKDGASSGGTHRKAPLWRCRFHSTLFGKAVATNGRPTAMMLKTLEGTANAAASGRCGTR